MIRIDFKDWNELEIFINRIGSGYAMWGYLCDSCGTRIPQVWLDKARVCSFCAVKPLAVEVGEGGAKGDGACDRG